MNPNNVTDPPAERPHKASADHLLRLVKEGVTDYAIILMNEAGLITSWNAGAERIFQYREAEILGQSCLTIFTREDRANHQAKAELESAIANGRADDEREHVRKDGTCFIASGVLTALHDENGELKGFVKVMRDITVRQKADRTLQQARHYETIAVLAGGFAHDFNNLLTSILGNISLVLDHLPTDSLSRRALTEAVDSSRRAAELTRLLLAYAGKGQFVNRRLQLSGLVADLGDLLRSSVSKRLRLQCEFGRNLPDITGDPAQIEQVVMNLVINAAEAMETKPGTISVSTGLAQLDQAHLDCLALSAAVPGNFVYFDVTDTGIGMDNKTLARVFDPFFTTKFIGRGLGLAAVSGIVRQHRGAIQVASKPGEGTSMRVYFPAWASSEN